MRKCIILFPVVSYQTFFIVSYRRFIVNLELTPFLTIELAFFKLAFQASLNRSAFGRASNARYNVMRRDDENTTKIQRLADVVCLLGNGSKATVPFERYFFTVKTVKISVRTVFFTVRTVFLAHLSRRLMVSL